MGAISLSFSLHLSLSLCSGTVRVRRDALDTGNKLKKRFRALGNYDEVKGTWIPRSIARHLAQSNGVNSRNISLFLRGHPAGG